MSVLTEIQNQLHAPKNQFNGFGKYKYRSCEDILEALKPVLLANKAEMYISDDVVAVGDRIYIKATIHVKTKDGEYQSSGFAREALSKKGMDESQITGSASSYARKYALNAMFAIDDTKDADTMNNAAPQAVQAKPDPKIINHMNTCNTLEELVGVWNSIPKEQHSLYNEAKDNIKAQLQKVA